MAVCLVKTCRILRIFRNVSKDISMKHHSTSNISNVLRNVVCSHYHTSVLRSKKLDPSLRAVTKGYKPKKKLSKVEVWKDMLVYELARNAQRSVEDVIKALKKVTPYYNYRSNTVINHRNVLEMAVVQLGLSPSFVNKEDTSKESTKSLEVVERPPPNPDALVKRRPVVCVMGHVDHGKTTLLDTLRNTSVVSTEFGGITQHIGAFNVTLKTGETMTFLDTPGHAAFSNMRLRSSQVTDIIVLVVAADDGVLNQTIECIDLAKEEKVPIVVAINKIDKPTADINRTENMLSQHGVLVESLGGSVQCVHISALKGTNVDTLIEAVALQADLMELKGDPTGLAEGTIIEATTDVRRGKLATVLVRRGTLRKGAIIVSGFAWAKVRSMFDHTGKIIQEAGLSDAVQIIGWRALPLSGDQVLEVRNDSEAQALIRLKETELSEIKMKEQAEAANKKLQEHLVVYKKRLEERWRSPHKFIPPEIPKESNVDDVPEVNLIMKADVYGTVEAILNVLDTYDRNDKCKLNIVHYGVGSITQNDITLAKTFKGIIYGFHVDVPKDIKELAKSSRVQINLHKVIYKLIDDIIEQINERLPTVTKEQEIGHADVLQQFVIKDRKKKVNVAGCRCVKGVLQKSAKYHLKRGDDIIYTGNLSSMKHLKDEVTSIDAGVECGLALDDPTIEFKPGDVLICFNTYDAKQTIDWLPDF